MAGGTQGGQVVESVGLDEGCEDPQRHLVMDIMLAVRFHGAADLAGVPVAGADPVTDARPVGAVVVRVVGPGAGFAQTRYRRLGEQYPVAGRHQVGGRQIERLLTQVFMGVPAALAEAGNLGRDLQLTPFLFAAGDSRLSGLR